MSSPDLNSEPHAEPQYAWANTRGLPCRCGCGHVFPYVTRQHITAAFPACIRSSPDMPRMPIPDGFRFIMPHAPDCPYAGLALDQLVP